MVPTSGNKDKQHGVMNLRPAAERGSALWGPSAQQPLSSASLPLQRTEHTVVSTNGPKQLKASS